MEIREIMRSPVISVKSDDTVGKVLEIMNEGKINGTPIVDKDNKLLGIIVKADIYRFLMEPGHIESCPVEWVMTKKVVKAQANEDVLEVAKRLRKKSVIALPVLEGDELVGLVSIEDIVDYFLSR
ncbi:MAG: CBS domain-containing protein [Firmicutes bacterium]|nr:CBS domain-containing protein [Bacillota bacterium]